MIGVCDKTVERAGSTGAAAVVAELEQMDDEPTLVDPGTFTDELHHQNQPRYHIVEVTDGQPVVIDRSMIAEPELMAALLQ